MSDWQNMQALFLESVDLPPTERSQFLNERCANDPFLLADITSLLAADNDSGAHIEAAVQDEAASLFDTQMLIGERLGLYRIIREIGRGGMGSVYLAERDDAEYRKRVALKIVRRGMDTADVLHRFRYERQILANLEHPYIARLFDGGSTADGVPFFVMEYIEGRQVSTFCRENALDPRAICELFLQILEAVAYAHRNLVVHRDLKPANILITSDGTPKLLDFGLAKLLGGDPDGNQTLTADVRRFTAGYASPEQVRGLPITTATDIYSLGTIFYELLTRERAQPIDHQTPSEIERAVCQNEPLRPSTQVHGLSTDLDNIILMALRKDPERRYESAAQFAEDIRRYLDGRPILAQQDSVSYRLKKFIFRNRLQAGAAALVTASLIVGLLVSLHQTHLARIAMRAADAQSAIAQHQTVVAEVARTAESHQRAEAEQQRSVADQQRIEADVQRDRAQQQTALADRRVKDILKLADHTLFDVHDAIAKLPGSVAARRTLVQTTLGYLTSLEREAGLDDEMRLSLSAAYYKVALIQGDTKGASLQDFQAAETSLLKAQKIIQPAFKRHPEDAATILRVVEVRATLADLDYRAGNRNRAVQSQIDLLPIAHKLSAAPGCPVECQLQEADLESTLTFEALSFDPGHALAHAKRGTALIQQLLALHPGDSALITRLGTLMAAEAGTYRASGELERASEFYKRSIDLREDLLRRDPNDAQLRRDLMIAYGNYATLLDIPWSPNLDLADQARDYASRGVTAARAMVAQDADNVTARHDLGMILSRLGMIDPSPGGEQASLVALQEAATLIEPIATANVKSYETTQQLAMIMQYKGKRLTQLKRNSEAAISLEKCIALLQPAVQAHNVAAIYLAIYAKEDLAKTYAASAELAKAEEILAKALAEMQEMTLHAPPSDLHTSELADLWATKADIEDQLGATDQAHDSANTALGLWRSTKNPTQLTSYRHLIVKTTKLASSSAVHEQRHLYQ